MLGDEEQGDGGDFAGGPVAFDDFGALAGGVGGFEAEESVVIPLNVEALDGGRQQDDESQEHDPSGAGDDDTGDWGPEARRRRVKAGHFAKGAGQKRAGADGREQCGS